MSPTSNFLSEGGQSSAPRGRMSPFSQCESTAELTLCRPFSGRFGERTPSSPQLHVLDGAAEGPPAAPDRPGWRPAMSRSAARGMRPRPCSGGGGRCRPRRDRRPSCGRSEAGFAAGGAPPTPPPRGRRRAWPEVGAPPRVVSGRVPALCARAAQWAAFVGRSEAVVGRLSGVATLAAWR
jgi:hypothetical protein